MLARQSTPVVPANKREADRMVGQIIRLDKQMSRNTEAAKKAAEKQNQPLQREREELIASLTAFGDKRLAEDGEIALGGKRKLYKHTADAVALDRPEREVVEDFRGNRFWRRRFLRRKVSYELDRVAVKKYPYIIKKILGLRVEKKQGLYLFTGQSKNAEELSSRLVD